MSQKGTFPNGTNCPLWGQRLEWEEFMSKIKDKIYDWKDRLRDRHMLTLVVTLVAIIVALGIFAYKKQTEFRTASENSYNAAC